MSAFGFLAALAAIVVAAAVVAADVAAVVVTSFLWNFGVVLLA